MPTALTERLLWLTVTVYSVICIDATGKEPGTEAASELGEVQTEPIKNHTVNFSCILYEKFGIINGYLVLAHCTRSGPFTYCGVGA